MIRSRVPDDKQRYDFNTKEGVRPFFRAVAFLPHATAFFYFLANNKAASC